MLNKKYFDIANHTIYSVMGNNDQDDVTVANSMLSKLLVENTDLKMYLSSTGKYQEYLAWIKRFKVKYPGVENLIKNNLELEETVETKSE